MRKTCQEHQLRVAERHSKHSVKSFGACCTMLPPVTWGKWYFLLFYSALWLLFLKNLIKKHLKIQLVVFPSHMTLGWKQITLMRMLFMDKCKAGWCHLNVWWNWLKSFSTLDSAAWWNTEGKYKYTIKNLLNCCLFGVFLHIHLLNSLTQDKY